MNILLCNDDGITDGGLKELAYLLKDNGYNIMIVAPKGNRSASSHSMSINKPIKIESYNFGKNIPAYAISGTPVDCIKMGILMFKEFDADLVVCGVNNGQNLGTDILYSGTLSSAIEGAFFNKKGIAISCTTLFNADHKLCAKLSLELIKTLYPITKNGEVWNVNIPHLKEEEIKGVKFTKLGKQIYTDTYEMVSEGEYKLVGELVNHLENDADCDVEWNKKGYITITPILYDKTDYIRLERVKFK